MKDFEMEFIAKQNELILQYGEKQIKTIGFKAAAIQILETAFQKLPDNLSFEEELSQLNGHVLELPKARTQLDKKKQQFLFNRFCEIVIENPEHEFIHKENDINKKVSAVEGIGLVVSKMSGDSKYREQVNLQVVFDLYDLYILQYGLYNQNPNHPIFLNAIIDGKVTPEKANISQSQTSSSEKGGCLGVVLVMFIIVVSLIALV